MPFRWLRVFGRLNRQARKPLQRFAILALSYSAILLASQWLAYLLRFDFAVSAAYLEQWSGYAAPLLLLQLLCLYLCGQFSGLLRYFSIPDLRRLGCATLLWSAVLLLSDFWEPSGPRIPRGVVLVQAILSFGGLAGLRLGYRLLCERYQARYGRAAPGARKVAVIGAGDAGAGLVHELQARRGLGLVPVVFYDDDRNKWGRNVHGIPVVGGMRELQYARQDYHVEEAIIAMPSAPPRRIAEVIRLLQKARLRYVTVPAIDQLATGQVRVSQLRPVRIEDLLGRDPVDLRTGQISGVLRGEVVLVTGAGGSIGSELCRQIASFQPARLLLVEQSEVQLFQIEQELIKLGYGGLICPIIADILDTHRVRAILRRHRPAVIFHAAAHKHVPMMEIQPGEAVKNNALGTAALARLALEHDVQRFVMISTDKAVNPTSVMGASKRMAEVYLQALARAHPGRTRFTAVRFGNVLGSSGSVVPIFEKQIAEGGPVTVTHPEVERYFMTIPEAVGLVLQSCALGEGGEVFVLDMGRRVRIADLARQMIRLCGFEPDRDIEIRYIGLRPGEKLFEELQHLTAHCADTAHPRIKRLTTEPMPFHEASAWLDRFAQWVDCAPPDLIRREMKAMLPEYPPHADRDTGNAAGGPAHGSLFEADAACWIHGDFDLCPDHDATLAQAPPSITGHCAPCDPHPRRR